MHVQEKAYLQHGHLEGSLQLMQGGGSQTAAAAPDEAQRWGAGRGEILISTSQQHLREERMVIVYLSHLLLVDLGMSSILTRMLRKQLAVWPATGSLMSSWQIRQ